MKLLKKAHQAVTTAAGKDASRYILQAVLIEETENGLKATATDGRMLAQVEDKAGTMTADDFPVLEAMKNAPNGAKKALIPAAALAGVKFPRKSTLPILSMALASLGETQSTFATTDLETANVQPARNIEGNFPAYEQVIPTGKNVGQVKMSVDLMVRALKVLKDTGADAFTLELFGERNAVKMTAETSGEKILVIGMPIAPDKAAG